MLQAEWKQAAKLLNFLSLTIPGWLPALAEINCFNIERRSIDRSITTEAMRMISDDPRLRNSKTTVLFNPQWKKAL